MVVPVIKLEPMTIINSLELRVPPPVVACLIAGSMWGIALVGPILDVPHFARSIAVLTLVIIGVSFSLAGVVSFRRAKTTVNPMKPGNTTTLVNSGIYRVTRNPMYVGFLFILIAWAVYLLSLWALLGPLAYIIYINVFQIVPEEKVLSAKFGATFDDYKARVRRWL
jgi:protein-S-isoprenylcysteine O-methyltransferase Ste14